MALFLRPSRVWQCDRGGLAQGRERSRQQPPREAGVSGIGPPPAASPDPERPGRFLVHASQV